VAAGLAVAALGLALPAAPVWGDTTATTNGSTASSSTTSSSTTSTTVAPTTTAAPTTTWLPATSPPTTTLTKSGAAPSATTTLGPTATTAPTAPAAPMGAAGPVTGTTTTTLPGATTSPSTSTSTTTTTLAEPTPGPPLGPQVESDALAVVTRDYQVPVTKANATLSAAQTKLTMDQAAVDTDRAVSAAAAAAVTTETQTLASDKAAHVAAVAAQAKAAAVLDADQDRLRNIAIALYIGPPNAVPVGAAKAAIGDTNVSVVEETGDAEESLAIAESVSGSSVGSDATRADGTAARTKTLASAITTATSTLATDRTTAATDAAEVVTEQNTVTTEQAAIVTDQAAITAATQAKASAMAAFTPAPPPPAPTTTTPTTTTPTTTTTTTPATPAAAQAAQAAAAKAAAQAAALVGGPTILGPSALSASQLVGWYASSGHADLTKAKFSDLAHWYLTNGTIEGVRGDVALAQAILETGGFSSADAVNLNNYAGIGHCDSCNAGLNFPSPEDGVIGQLQLLRTYAESSSAAALPQPLVLASLAPASQSRLGCCQTWNSLTGVWATDPDYGPEILAIYDSMLQYALDQPPVAPPATQTNSVTSLPAAPAVSSSAVFPLTKPLPANSA
jgi:uncharacterized membrane protein